MKATTIIAQLAKLVQEHGDGDVRLHAEGATLTHYVSAPSKSIYHECDVDGEPVFEIYGE